MLELQFLGPSSESPLPQAEVEPRHVHSLRTVVCLFFFLILFIDFGEREIPIYCSTHLGIA